MAKQPSYIPTATIPDPVTLMNACRSFVSMLGDPGAKEENKLKAVQELSGVLEIIVANPQYPAFLEHSLRIFLKILEDGEPHFISEHNTQQLRKLILEIIHRIPTNEHLRPHVKVILSLMFKLLEVENEENVLVCLRIIIELHKTFRPAFSPEIQHFLQFVKYIYKELPNQLDKIFEPRLPPKVKDLSVANLEATGILAETFTITSLTLEMDADGTVQLFNLIPRASLSLKVFAELPIIVVQMYQLYKQNVHQEVEEFVPLIMTTITLQPSLQHRNHLHFNKEVFVDFMAAQIKTLSFLAYVVRIYQETVNLHSAHLAQGMIGLLRLCPPEVAYLRKELLIAARHILATDLREKFVGYFEELFDENILIGSGWTAYESLRPLAYTTLADLVHRVRQHLPLKDLTNAVTFFSKNVHDESLVTSIQSMSCKLLLNLVECICTRSDKENGNGREILMRLQEVFVLKFKTISRLQLPVLSLKFKQQLQQAAIAQNLALASNMQQQINFAAMTEVRTEPKDDTKTPLFPLGGLLDGRDEKPKFGFPASQAANYSIADTRILVKTLICCVKTVTWGITTCQIPGDNTLVENKMFLPKETLVFIRLFKYALQALDVYTLPVSGAVQPQPRQAFRSKEEKEILEQLAGVYTMMNPLTFQEIFSVSIDYMVDRIYKNMSVQTIALTFLANSTTSPIFATILVEYLLKRMEEMGSKSDRSSLYLKLFKIVFDSVSAFPAENEQMLKPHLHQIVNKSMELALTAQEPSNYFLLLRALFRSIGGGSHDLLYQEFLPLLPELLQGLHSLQSGLHKPNMKDLLVELCLTFPVRLSSLLPFLPMLMNPLVSALNGSQTLIKQGLRTLELCVDNLQSDFLYDHIQPVRAELMQALWRTLHNPVDSIAQVAFRVLGKFGGNNRKVMVEPQKLEYSACGNVGPCIAVSFPEHRNSISLPVGKIIETAVNALKSNNTDSFYQRQSWEVIKGFLAANIADDNKKHNMIKLFSHPSFSYHDIAPMTGPLYKCPDAESRKIHVMALTGVFVASAVNELRPVVLPFLVKLVRHYTAVLICQQCGPFVPSGKQIKLSGMDGLVIIDATAEIMGIEEKEFCKPGSLALVLIFDTATTILASKAKASCLPFYEYLAEKMCSLCYERAWYAKLGGCIAIKTLYERLPELWVYAHQYAFLKAFFFVMMDLTGEVSSGAIDLAKINLEKMLTRFGVPLIPNGVNDDMVEAQAKSHYEVVQELVRLVTSPNTCVREQAIHSLKVLAIITNKTVTAIMEPHKDQLADMIPPRKHLLHHQPVNAQIGLLDGNTFCITLEPRLFIIDLQVEEHRTFFSELLTLCDSEDAALQKMPCYKPVTNLVPLRKAALRVLAACHFIEDKRRDIFIVLYKSLNSTYPELPEAGFECMQQFLNNCHIDMDVAHNAIRPLILKMADYRSLSLQVIQQLSYLTQLFPNSFNEDLCEQLLSHLHECLEVAAFKTKEKIATNEMKICSAIINVFHQIPIATPKFIEHLLMSVLKTENTLMMEVGSPLREPLIKFLQLFPAYTVELLLSDSCIQDEKASRFMQFLLKGDKGKPFRDVLQQNPTRLVTMVFLKNQHFLSTSTGPSSSTSAVQEMQYQAIRTVSLLVKYDDQWLSGQHQLVAFLRIIWISDEFQDRHLKIECVDYTQWKEPKLLAKCLLNYFKHNPNEIELLFQLLRAFTGRFIPNFEFLRDFLENTVANTYTFEWKRIAFFKFVSIFHDTSFPPDLKAKILQYILIPSFAVAFERGEDEGLIGGPPAPEYDLNDNAMSVFINKVIDPDHPFATSDAIRILLLQFSCLLVEQASPHIHDAANKKQGNKLRRLMTFAWPCLLGKNFVDPTTKYHGHLLLANIIAKFAINKKIVLQVFHSLLKAHAAEARVVVRQALEILTPAMPVRMEDGKYMLTHWTKKIIVEEGHILPQLVHLLQLLVRHYKVYYPVRHHLITHMVNSVQRLVFTQNATIDHRKLGVDLAEVIIRWELQRYKEEQEKFPGIDQNEVQAVLRVVERQNLNVGTSDLHNQGPETSQSYFMGMKRATLSESQDLRRAKNLPGTSMKIAPDRYKPVDKAHADAIVNFLLRMACQVNETSTTAGSTGELLSKRCVALLKLALKPDVWPNAEIKLAWFDKLLVTVEGQQPNYGNICTALELLAFLLTILREDTILATFRPLQRGIAACLICNNSKVIRSVHSLLLGLMTIFPIVPTNSDVASKYEELECLYAAISKVVFEGLASYEKSTTASTSAQFGTLMILKAACFSNLTYIDRFISFFMKALLKMTTGHLSTPCSEIIQVETDLLILSLDLVKNRVSIMDQNMRKIFINTILVGLIEKSPDVRVLKIITKIVEDWIRIKSSNSPDESLTIQEKSILQVKMMQFIERRFPDELELNAQFLELVHYVFTDESLKGSELQSRLEPAFMAGLRCIQPHIRAKFSEVYDGSIRRKMFERLMHIVRSQNWESIGPHFWIMQCIEFLLVCATSGTTIKSATPNILLPSITSVIDLADSHEQANFAIFTSVKEESMDVESENKEDEEMDMELSSTDEGNTRSSIVDITISTTQGKQYPAKKQDVTTLVSKLLKFLESLQEVKTLSFLTAASQLCHMDTSLAQHIWVQLFPRLWNILDEKQQHAFGSEVAGFLCSNSHVLQKDCHPSAPGVFAEAISHCVPPVQIRPQLLEYLGKSYNMWHRSCLLLEQIYFEKVLCSQVKLQTTPVDHVDAEIMSFQHETLDAISHMYAQLKEDDLWSSIWQKKAKYSETCASIALEQQGFFADSQNVYEKAISRHKQETIFSAPITMESENTLWTDHWLRCARELNQWEFLCECSSSKASLDPYLILESAWRSSNWALMQEALDQMEQNCPREFAWKVNLYRGYLSICDPEGHHLNVVERSVELASNLSIREWRRLPHIVSHIHLPILQAAHHIMELQDASQIHQSLLPVNVERSMNLHDMKAIIKTWRFRLPVLSDDLSHWSEIIAWRQEHFRTISTCLDPNEKEDTPAKHVMLGVHASAQSTIQYGKIARKQGLTSVCLEALGKIRTNPSIPIIDRFKIIRQQVKCYFQMAHSDDDMEESTATLKEGLNVTKSAIESAFFTKEMKAEFHAMKGMFLAQLGQSREANIAFSEAIQVHDSQYKAWALWGEYLEAVFTNAKSESRQMTLGVSALTCFLHSCRHQNENKSRKYLAKVLWLLTYDDAELQLAETVDKYSLGVPPVQWVPWIPQLLTCLIRNEGRLMLNVLNQIGRIFPQAIYFPIRTLYLILKIEQREKYQSEIGGAAGDARLSAAQGCQMQNSNASVSSSPFSLLVPPLSDIPHGSSGTPYQPPDPSSIRASTSMWRCSRIMQTQKDLHPIVLSSLEGIVDQMVWFRENVYEEVLRQLRQGLAKCYAVAYENAGAISEATVTPHTSNFVKKMVSIFGIGIENVSSISTTFSSAASESLARRAEATAQDPVFQKMKIQFTADFDFSVPGAMKLYNLINKLQKWIKILEAKTKLLPKSFLIEEKCRFLSNFSQQTAEVELPGEFLLPRHNHYCIRIARFMPRVDIVQKHNTAARRLYIKGHNGKTYPYLVVNDTCLSDARREERVLQLLRMLNNFLGKQKETSRRLLHFTVPKVVSVSPHMRLVEDNVSSISLLDIYKQGCTKRGIDYDAPLVKYYDHLATVQARGLQATQQMLRDILKDVQTNMVSPRILMEWAEQTYPCATDYWTFRKQFILQLSLAGFVEYVLHLTRLNPDMMYIHRDSGLMNICYFRFDVNDVSGELDTTRPVPFRLTPNISEFITTIGISGPMSASMISTAHCLAHPSFKIQALLRAILRDEMISWHKKRQDDVHPNDLPQDMEGNLLIQMVTKAVSVISTRLISLATFEGADSSVNTLVASASSLNNLCRVDPAWHPWL